MTTKLLSRSLRDDLLSGTALAAGLGAYFYGVSAIFGPWVPPVIASLTAFRAGRDTLNWYRSEKYLSMFRFPTPFTAESPVGRAVDVLAQRAGIRPPRVYIWDTHSAHLPPHIITIPPEALTEDADLRENALPSIAHEIAHLRFDKLVGVFENFSNRILHATSKYMALGVVGVGAGAVFFSSIPSVPVVASCGLIGLFNVLGHMGINYSSRVREVRADRSAGILLGQPDAMKRPLTSALTFYQAYFYSAGKAPYGWAIHVHDLFSSHPSLPRRIREIEKNALKADKNLLPPLSPT